jgi:hypothetical protein
MSPTTTRHDTQERSSRSISSSSSSSNNKNKNNNINMTKEVERAAISSSSDASVTTDKNTTATSTTSSMTGTNNNNTNNNANKQVRGSGGSLSDGEKSMDASGDQHNHQQQPQGNTLEVPPDHSFSSPLRINATRVVPIERLSSASTSNLQIPLTLQGQVVQAHRRRKSDSGMSALSSRSASRSPGRNTNYFDAGSSLSSLEDIIDPDILTDKMGLVELDVMREHYSNSRSGSFTNLPLITERMSDETLEDSHAFSDVVRRHVGNVSRGNSITTGGEVSSNVLEALDEGDDDEDSNNDGGGGGGQVILTNMEEILEVAEEEIHDMASSVDDDDDDDDDDDEEEEQEDAGGEMLPDMSDFATPLRVAMMTPERRLSSGSSSNLQIPPNILQQGQGHVQHRRRKSDSGQMVISTLSSRSGSFNFDGGSSLASLEEFIDPDILTDKLGLLELEHHPHHHSSSSSNRAGGGGGGGGLNHSSSFSNLPPVTERMSDETLDDVHAFSDIKARHSNVSSSSRGGGNSSITTGGEVSSNMLEPLDEGDDDEDSNDDDNGNGDGKVIFTNMEEILEVAEEQDIPDSAASVPTA